MKSFSYIRAVDSPSSSMEHRRLERISPEKWRMHSLSRLCALARTMGLTEESLCLLAGVSSLHELTLNAMGVLADELGAWERNNWD